MDQNQNQNRSEQFPPDDLSTSYPQTGGGEPPSSATTSSNRRSASAPTPPSILDSLKRTITNTGVKARNRSGSTTRRLFAAVFRPSTGRRSGSKGVEQDPAFEVGEMVESVDTSTSQSTSTGTRSRSFPGINDDVVHTPTKSSATPSSLGHSDPGFVPIAIHNTEPEPERYEQQTASFLPTSEPSLSHGDKYDPTNPLKDPESYENDPHRREAAPLIPDCSSVVTVVQRESLEARDGDRDSEGVRDSLEDLERLRDFTFGKDRDPEDHYDRGIGYNKWEYPDGEEDQAL